MATLANIEIKKEDGWVKVLDGASPATGFVTIEMKYRPSYYYAYSATSPTTEGQYTNSKQVNGGEEDLWIKTDYYTIIATPNT